MRKTNKKMLYVTSAFAIIFLLLVFRFFLLQHWLKDWPKIYFDVLNALIILIIGYTTSYFLEGWVFSRPAHQLGLRRQAMLRFITRLVLYLAVTLAVLTAFGVGASGAIFGGAFITAIIGLAGQAIFSNLLGGIALVLTRPFEMGDRIKFMTWQYPVLMPSYPHEALMPAYTGEIIDLNIMHTAIRTDEGPVMLVPNGIVIQAAILNLTRTPDRRVRIRFDVDVLLDPRLVETGILAALGAEEWIAPEPPPQVNIVELNTKVYSLVVVFTSKLLHEQEAKNAAYRKIIGVLGGIGGEKPSPA